MVVASTGVAADDLEVDERIPVTKIRTEKQQRGKITTSSYSPNGQKSTHAQISDYIKSF